GEAASFPTARKKREAIASPARTFPYSFLLQTYASPARSTIRNLLLCRRAFQLDQNQVQWLIVNVLRGVGQRFAKKNLAGLQLAFRNFPIRRVIAIPPAFHNINYVGRMRVH